MRILHLSDTHLDAQDGPNAKGYNASDSLRIMLHDLRHLDAIDLVVVSGDIADDGSRPAYERARSLIERFARPHGCPVVFSTGNHDERVAFASVLRNGHVGASGPSTSIPTFPDEIAAVTIVAGYRVITLDSLVPAKGYGLLTETQLAWLETTLREPADRGTILAFHHPPVALDVEVQRRLGLQDAERLADVISGTDVQLILCGHFHLQIAAQFAGAFVWVTPGVVSRIDLTGPPGTERAVRGASASLIELGGPTSPLVHSLHARDPEVGREVYELDAEALARAIDSLGR